MRHRGFTPAAIEAALLEQNRSECNPPIPEAEVRRIPASAATWPAGRPMAQAPAEIWAGAESMATFLSADADSVEFLDAERHIVARECITEIFAPRGLGKSLYALWLAVQLARCGLRVMLIDRDNPRHIVKSRLLAFGATGETSTLKTITREKCPPLTNTAAWARFPYSDYDMVIIDSLDSAAEGVGEQDSAKPSRAIAPLLDIARRENGPAVLILGNTVKSALHSRGSGVIEDRADIVYEVRDATDFHPTGRKPWVEELPPADAGSWASRASRRKQREKYRLAFVASKFRIGQEPEPFILEIDTTADPWTVRDVTDDVDREGAEARQQRAAIKAAGLQSAADRLKAEILRRANAGDPPLGKRQDAEPFLMMAGLKRAEAREVLEARNGRDWTLTPSLQDRRITHVMLAAKSERDGHISTLTEPAKKGAIADPDCGRPVSMHSATFDTHENPERCSNGEPQNVAEDSVWRLFT